MRRQYRSMYNKDHLLQREWFSVALIVFMFVLAFVAVAHAPRFSGNVAVAIDGAGAVQETGSLFGTIFLLPIVALALYIVLMLVPKIAVYKRNVNEFYRRHFGFKIIMILFLVVVYITQLLPVFLIHVEQLYFIVPALAVMLFYLGHLLRHLHRNYFFGIKTPWTLARDDVWNKTHKFGSAVFEVSGLLLFVGLLWPMYFGYILAAIVIIATLVTIVYSYLIFTRDHV